MKVVSVIAQNGGKGNTTLTVVACAAGLEQRSVAIVDLDPRATATTRSDRRDRESPIVIRAQPPRLARILVAPADQGVDLAVVDTAPRVEASAVAAARAAHLVVVPCRPAVYDLQTVAATAPPATDGLPAIRVGKSSVTGYFPPAVRRQLRRLAADRDTTIQALLGEALNALFAKHDLPELVENE